MHGAPDRTKGAEVKAPAQREAPLANDPVLVTAARLRILLNVNGLVWAAARDGGR